MTRSGLVLAALTLAAAAAARAQDVGADSTPREERGGSGGRPFLVSPSIGIQLSDRASALARSVPVASLDVNYRLTPVLAIGFSGSAARPKTDGRFFSLVELPAGDTSDFYRVSQRVTQFTYAVQAVASFTASILEGPRLHPYVLASVGGYTFTMDPQAMGRTTRYSGPSAAFGGGLRFPIGANAGVLFDARDVIFFSYERSRLDATDPLLRTDKFDPVPLGKPAAKSTAHNIRLSLGVTFVPRGRGE
ncbi:MAG TPA: hypothetical protein VKA84_28970 [Gemmatimonadaceae bacterium]|nr:hypothetical protein [Gemmatimonadaceae bacterium]